MEMEYMLHLLQEVRLLNLHIELVMVKSQGLKLYLNQMLKYLKQQNLKQMY